MATIALIAEEEATGKVRDIYEDIKQVLGLDFVPNMYRAMARRPAALEASWNQVKAVMHESGALDRMTKEIIAVSVSAVMGCEY